MTTTPSTGNAQALMPLSELLETYNQCLFLSRDFVDKQLKADEMADPDIWDDFLRARADLFEFAELSLRNLSFCELDENADDYEERRDLTDKVLNVLGEMGEIENRLAAFLGENLDMLKATIMAMQRSEPVFKRYGQLPPKNNINLIDHTF